MTSVSNVIDSPTELSRSAEVMQEPTASSQPLGLDEPCRVFLETTTGLFDPGFINEVLDQQFGCQSFQDILFIAKRFLLVDYMSTFGQDYYTTHFSGFRALRILSLMCATIGDDSACTIANYSAWSMALRATQVMSVKRVSKEEQDAKRMIFNSPPALVPSPPQSVNTHEDMVSPVTVQSNPGRTQEHPLYSTGFGGGSCGDTRNYPSWRTARLKNKSYCTYG